MRSSIPGRSDFPINRLREEMDRLVSDFFGPSGSPASFMPRLGGAAYPAVNVWEDGDNVYAEAELAGLKSEDLELTVVNNELTIRGKRAATEQEGASYHRRERGVGEFTRTLRLPTAVDSEHVEAKLVNGVLTVKLPKAQAARPRRVEVRAEG